VKKRVRKAREGRKEGKGNSRKEGRTEGEKRVRKVREGRKVKEFQGRKEGRKVKRG
jgi:hypothetical protein